MHRRFLYAMWSGVFGVLLAACSSGSTGSLPSLGANAASAGVAATMRGSSLQPSWAERPVAGAATYALARGLHGHAHVAVTVRFPRRGAADFAAAFPRRPQLRGARFARRPLKSGTAVYVYAYLYPSYADYHYGYFQGVATIGANDTLKLAFASVPKANNEWIEVDVYANTAPTGGLYLGSEAAVLNVNSARVTATVNAATTLVFQGFEDMLYNGLLTASDLKNAGLATTIKGLLQRNGLTPSPVTGVYTGTQLQEFTTAVTPSYQRMMTVNGGSTATTISIANDPSDTPDINLYFNSDNSQGFNASGSVTEYGEPCYGDSGVHLPGKNSPPVPFTCAATITVSGGATVPVFGGGLLVGGTNGTAPYVGALTKAVGGNPASSSTVNLTFSSTNQSLTTSDPYDWAYGQIPNGSDVYSTLTALGTTIGGCCWSVPIAFPSNYSAANPAISVNSWNPWGIPLADYSLCTTPNYEPSSGCTASPVSGTLAIQEPFQDPGTNGTYWNWQGGGGSTIAYSSACQAYQLGAGSNGAVTMTTTVPTVFTPTPTYYVDLVDSSCATTPLPAGLQVTLSVVGSDGQAYSGSATSQAGGYVPAFTLSTISSLVVAKSVTLTITPAAGTTVPQYLSAITL